MCNLRSPDDKEDIVAIEINPVYRSICISIKSHTTKKIALN
jgi:hypothetical protein